MPRITSLIFGLLLCTWGGLYGQQLDYRQGELIVQLGADVDAKRWLAARSEIASAAPLGQDLRTYLLRFDHAVHGETELLRRYWRDPAVELVQLNHLLTHRRRPNDPRFDLQWQYDNVGQLTNGVVGADFNIESAWDVTTGGVTANGDTIVVAVLDSGTDLDHEDLIGNQWRNYGEIPDNNLDDDNNGYVDDYYGYNTAGDNADVDAGTDGHGVAVAGIIGAVGNNGLGVAGINWDVKVMTIRNNFFSSEAEVLQAYSYALEARLRYDASDGREGAYVVVTNASWGADRTFSDESPIWCGLYDRLGAAGILNMGATINEEVNVEEEGDLPTNCPSEYLIGVTNLTTADVKIPGAGFGNVSIDIGAYGEDVYTTELGNGYGPFNGTSSATPHVAGAAALLYSAPCQSFAELLVADPAAAALSVREVILSTAKPNASLAGITVTGGRLDIGAAMAEMMSRCDDCLAPTSFSVVPKAGSATEIVVDWRVTASLGPVDLRYRPTGTAGWTVVSGVTAPYVLGDLPMCVGYDFQLTASCGSTPVATPVRTASTDGCCTIPDDFRVVAGQDQRFSAIWSPLLAARTYQVRYRPLGEQDWQERRTSLTFLGIAGEIPPCTAYEFQLRADCDTLETAYSPSVVLNSTGCGACQEKTYCTPEGFDNSREWIAEVNLAEVLVNRSGPAPDGYRDYGEVTQQSLVRGGVYPLELSPGFPNGDDIEEFTVHIDWDQNGVFTNDELVVKASASQGTPASGVITVPDDAELLLTRMRVVMEFINVRGGPCSDNGNGEVEDYCINIATAEGCPPPKALRATYDAVEDVTLIMWRASAAAGGDYRLRYRPQGSNDAWVEQDISGISARVEDLNLCGAFEVEVASICDGSAGQYRHFYFDNQCTGTADRRLPAGEWSIAPNPAIQHTRVRWSFRTASRLRLFSAGGQLLRSLVPTGAGNHTLDISALPGGVYFVELRTQDGRSGLKRLVVR